jgi:hypothetical protein
LANEIHQTSLSAWHALSAAGGLEMDERDQDLAEMLKARLDATAPDLESAIAGASLDSFLSALFASIQPFVAMFTDILAFFEKAGAKTGQSQWRVGVGEEFLDFRHFEELLENWNAIDAEFEVPALELFDAFILNNARRDVGGGDFLLDGLEYGKPASTGVPDVDDWLAEYDKGRYAPFPSSLMPENFPAGLSDAATVTLAAVAIVRRQGLSRQEIIEEHRSRRFRSVATDALHPSSIAQNETDYWLRFQVGYLANITRRPEQERQALAAKLVEKFSPFARRRVPVRIEFRDLERILSLPIWKRRYETYGVWIATQILGPLEDHDVAVHSDKGELKFAFGEAKIADIETANPSLSLFSERRVRLADPIGGSRTYGAQPDFGVWTRGPLVSDCVLVVEVKHYKKRSKRNFREALIDYSRAHPRATVVLVNYGPVGEKFEDLPRPISERCRMIGPLTPETSRTRAEFSNLVRGVVGDPVRPQDSNGLGGDDEIVAVDVSRSMSSILSAGILRNFLARSLDAEASVALIDQDLRAVLAAGEIEGWLLAHELGTSTSLAGPVRTLLSQYKQVIVITDEGGMLSLGALNIRHVPSPLSEPNEAIFLRVNRDEIR